jgi:hypothetical protein
VLFTGNVAATVIFYARLRIMKKIQLLGIDEQATTKGGIFNPAGGTQAYHL